MSLIPSSIWQNSFIIHYVMAWKGILNSGARNVRTIRVNDAGKEFGRAVQA